MILRGNLLVTDSFWRYFGNRLFVEVCLLRILCGSMFITDSL